MVTSCTYVWLQPARCSPLLFPVLLPHTWRQHTAQSDRSLQDYLDREHCRVHYYWTAGCTTISLQACQHTPASRCI